VATSIASRAARPASVKPPVSSIQPRLRRRSVAASKSSSDHARVRL
jgi:hypothetical protein